MYGCRVRRVLVRRLVTQSARGSLGEAQTTPYPWREGEPPNQREPQASGDGIYDIVESILNTG
jgi:hypothetical protein